MQINAKELNLQQLRGVDDALEAFIFKQGLSGENWETSYKKNPQQFKKLINALILYKRDLMKYFRAQYENRYNLINQYVVKMDEYDDFFYSEQWGIEDQTLAPIIEQHNTIGADLGIFAMAYSLDRYLNFTSADMQKEITKRAVDISKEINATTQKRLQKQIKTAVELGETRAELDQRIQKIMINSFRGNFISQYETLTSYMEGKKGVAFAEDLMYKTWLGAQAKDSICGDTSGQTVKIDEPFRNGLMGPLAHGGCRCDIEYSDKNN